MASVQVLPIPPQVGFQTGRSHGFTPVSIPFHSIRIASRMKKLAWKDNRSSAFWSDAILAEVGGKTYLAKVYTHATGGERAFTRDLELLWREDGSANIPRVFGLSDDTATPCILFSAASLTPLCDYLTTLVAKSPEDALRRGWQLLINMRDVCSRVLANHPSLGSMAIRDAIEKALVDDQENIVLSPNYEDSETSYQESVGEVIRFGWAAVLQRAYLRPLRPLGYALDGDAPATLSKSPSDFDSMESALEYLRHLWLPFSSRYLDWPLNLRSGRYAPGDVGVFEMNSSGALTFRKLDSALQDLGGVEIALNVSDFEQVGQGVFRVTCQPHNKGSLKDFMLCWRNQLKQRAMETDWLRENAMLLASKYQVSPHDLVLLTETVHGLDAPSLESLTKNLHTPIHYYVHMDDGGRAWQRYWTFNDRPKSSDELSRVAKGDDPDATGMSFPHVDMHLGDEPFPTRYLQVESVEFA